jgi:hypothetical protein
MSGFESPRSLALRISVCALIALMSRDVGGAQAQGPDGGFGDHFEQRTMRLDYFHSGGMGEEIVALDRIVSDGAWAGSLSRLVDDTNLGKYLFEVVEPGKNQVIYSRGFASIYGEWETTSEARQSYGTFHESLRFPWPLGPVQVVLKKRDPDGVFREIWSLPLDPESRFVNPASPPAEGRVWPVFESGAPTDKVDLVLLGEGYTEAEMDKFHSDVARLVERLFETEPFKTRKSDFNVWAIDLPSDRSGVNRPHVGQFRRTPVSAEYNIFGSERYLLTFDNRRLRDILSAAPYEFVEILVNEEQYGGGGIYNFQATTAVDTDFADYIFVHEFGHHFAGLADEYYTSSVAYEPTGEQHREPWEPNVTALLDPSHLKWADLVEEGTPLPTPWDKEEYETHAHSIQARRQALIDSQAPEAEFDALFEEQRRIERELLHVMQHSDHVGAFEGAMYESHGLYRSEADCIMFTRTDYFCRVCRRALERIIDLYSS